MRRYMVHLLVPPSERQPTDWEMDLKVLEEAQKGFRQILAKDDDRICGELAAKSRPSLFYDIRHIRDVSAVVYVSRSEPDNPRPRQIAVTVLLGGIEEDDSEALELARRALWQINDHVFDRPSLERAAHATRPLQLSSFRSVDDYEDDMVRICIAAIAQVFFDIWGLNDVTPDVPTE